MLAWFWEMFVLFDSKVLAVFTRFCHWFQRLTGRTNFWLARWTVAGAGLSLIASFSKEVGDFQKHSNIGDIFILLFVAFTCVVVMPTLFLDALACEKQDEGVLSEEKSIEERIANQRSVKWRFVIFCFSLLMSPVILSEVMDILALARDLFAPILWIYAYLIAVNPLPPGTSKIGEWLKGLFAKTKPIEADSGA